MDGSAKAARSKAWIEQIKALKGKAPAAEKKQPDEPEYTLNRVELYYWEIFAELNAQRTADSDGIPSPLTLSDIRAAADLFRVARGDYEVYTYVMLALDREYVALVREEIRAKKEREARKARQQRDRKRG